MSHLALLRRLPQRPKKDYNQSLICTAGSERLGRIIRVGWDKRANYLVGRRKQQLVRLQGVVFAERTSARAGPPDAVSLSHPTFDNE